jgi:hypothetical protein
VGAVPAGRQRPPGAGVLTRHHGVGRGGAQAFYRKMGFADVGSAVFFAGPDRQTDRVMARVLP